MQSCLKLEGTALGTGKSDDTLWPLKAVMEVSAYHSSCEPEVEQNAILF